MSRRIRMLVIVFITSFALGSAACASVAGPSGDCGAQHSGTC